MMLATALMAAQAPISEMVLKTSVVEAAVFKPGLVYVVREVAVPAGTGVYRLDRIPQALDGTLWTASPDGAQVSELRTTLDTGADGAGRDPVTIPELIFANVGRSVRIVAEVPKDRESITGTVLPQSPDSGSITVRLASGALRQIQTASIIEATALDGSPSFRAPTPRVAIRFRVKAMRPSRIRITDLEIGAAWVANYQIRLSGDQGDLQAAAQLGLAELALDGTHVRLVSGLPNLNSGAKLDMGVGATSLQGYLEGTGGSLSRSAMDPFVTAEGLIRRVNANFGAAPVLESGVRLVPQSINYIAYDPTDNSLVTRGSGDANLPQFLQRAINASRTEDLHVYDFGPVTLPAGGRITRILSQAKVTTRTLYRWDVGSEGGFERTLRIRNSSGTAWPAGQILLQSDGLPIAQVPLPLTLDKQEASLYLGLEEDILHSVEVRELSRRPVDLAPPRKIIETTNEVTLTVTNTRATPVDAEIIDGEIRGVVTAHEAGTVFERAVNDRLNPQSVVTWHVRLAPGEKRTLKLTYRENVP
jgi:hypothetical protein